MIRALGPDDVDAFIALRRSGLTETPLAFAASPADDFTNDREAVRRGLATAPERVTFGAFMGDHLVGVVTIVRESREKMHHKAGIYGMYVAPEARRHGLARQLLQTAIDHGRSIGVRVLALSVSDATPEARRVYERVGFVRWGTEPDALLHGGQLVDEHHMVLHLVARDAPIH